LLLGRRSGAEDDGSLLERDRELDRIGRHLRQAREGGGGALLVGGPAGIGKTAVLGAAREAAESEGFRVLRARGAELEREFAFGVVRQLVEPLLAEASDEERAVLLDGPPGVAARLLGLPLAPDAANGPAPAAPDPSFAVLHGLYWLVVNLTAERPVALVVDDVHWADGGSLRFLTFLLPRLEGLRASVLLAARPAEGWAAPEAELLAGLAEDPATEVLRLGPLTADAIGRLIAAVLRSEPDPRFAEACREATGGTPFLVRTLIATLAEEGVAPVADSVVTVQSIATRRVGPWALVQLARLGPAAARIARAVAVLERAEPAQAARLARLPPSEAAGAVELLVRAGLLVERPLAFVHPILRAGLYGEIPAAVRAEAHGRAARLLAADHADAPRVAEHLLATDPVGDDWVVERLRVAARAAAASGAPESAVAYLRRALTEPPSTAASVGVLRDLGLAELNAARPGWEQHLEAAVDAARDDQTRISAGLLLGTALAYHMRLAEAVAVCDRVAARLVASDDQARLIFEALAVTCAMSDSQTAPSMAERIDALMVIAEQRSGPSQVLAIAAVRSALANQPADHTADLARRALAAAPRMLSDRREPPFFLLAVTALVWTERYDEAQALLDGAVTEARGSADGLLLHWALSLRAWLALRRGDLVAAEADARATLEGPTSAPPLWNVQAAGALAAALVERGDLEQAEQTLAPLAAELRGTIEEAESVLHTRGRLRVAQLRLHEALDDFLAAGRIAVETRAVSPCFLPWRSDAALVQLRLGDRDSAQRLSTEELDLARAVGAPRALGVALRAAGLVTARSGGEPLLREAIEVLGASGDRLEEARARTDLGALLRRGNRRVEARELLRQAVDAAHRAGAVLLAGRAETELRATGARPRRVLLTGLEALTASERRIAELAAEGLTNREIAQHLFVTARTVEGHLTNVFDKLDVGNRVDLSLALARSTARAGPRCIGRHVTLSGISPGLPVGRPGQQTDHGPTDGSVDGTGRRTTT
jgi:DNA-binding CsgD family transcriptional regulator